MNEEQFAELAAGYALDALSPEDRSEFETARAQHPEWERLVMADAAAAAVLAEGVARVQPSPAVREALLARITVTPQDAAVQDSPTEAFSDPGDAPTEVIAGRRDGTVEGSQPTVAETGITEPVEAPAAPPNTETIQAISRSRWTRGMLGLAASLVLLVGLGFGAVSIGQLLNRPAAVAALEEIENAPDAQSASAEIDEGGGNATVHWSESVGKVVLVSSGLPSIEADESFELWYVREGTPVSAGTFEDPTRATVLLEGTMEPGDVIAVTVEPQGGSPTGEPTSEPIVAIPTAA
jgi:anti-sigma-K factor RskA